MPAGTYEESYYESYFKEGRYLMGSLNFTWNPQWHHPYESLYSLLHKLALANVSTVRELQRTLSSGVKHEKLQNWCDRDRNLHGFGALDSSMVAQAFRTSEESLRTTIATTYLREQEMKTLTSEHWRVCPACLTEGFHATIYQLAFVARCPRHEVPLLTTCPACQAPLPRYALTKESFTSSYGCRVCGKIWWHPGEPAIHRPDENRTALLREAHEWLVRRKLVPTVEPNLWRLNKFGYDARGLYESARSLPHRWADLMGSPVPHHLGVERQSVEHYMLPLLASERGQHGLDDRDATKIYRTFRRHLERHILHHHLRCVRRLGKCLWWNAVQREVQTTGLCPYAYAYLLWRMRWERIEVPQQLFAKQRRLWHESPQISCDWLPQDLPHIAMSRLFGLECLQSYHQCLSFSTKMDGEGRLLFPIWQIANGRKVEWALELKTSTGCARLHWWWHTTYPTLRIAPKHPDRSLNKPSSDLLCLAC